MKRGRGARLPVVHDESKAQQEHGVRAGQGASPRSALLGGIYRLHTGAVHVRCNLSGGVAQDAGKNSLVRP